ncbi:heterokaryon incompatibility, partial [Schizothecium vesticola]
YEALSYIWGAPDILHPVLINGCAVKVRRNLHTALLEPQDIFIARVVWIGAICINQDNFEERAQQVQIMTKIYAMASRVVVWLG